MTIAILPRAFVASAAVGAMLLCPPALGLDGPQSQPATGTISGTLLAKRVKVLEYAVVYIKHVEGGDYPPRSQHEVIDQQGKKYVPHVVAVLKGTTVDFKNSDPVVHNTFSPDYGGGFNLGNWGQGETRSKKFDVEGVATILCELHPEMNGYVVVLQNPYFTIATPVVDPEASRGVPKKATFQIGSVPPGKYTLVAWHERLKQASVEIEVRAGETATVTMKLK